MEEVAEEATVVSQLYNGLFVTLSSGESRDFALKLVGGVDSELEKLKTKLKMVENLLSINEEIQLKKDGGALFDSSLFNVQKGFKIKVLSRRLERLRQPRPVNWKQPLGKIKWCFKRNTRAKFKCFSQISFDRVVGIGGVGKMKMVQRCIGIIMLWKLSSLRKKHGFVFLTTMMLSQSRSEEQVEKNAIQRLLRPLPFILMAYSSTIERRKMDRAFILEHSIRQTARFLKTKSLMYSQFTKILELVTHSHATEFCWLLIPKLHHHHLIYTKGRKV